MELLSTQLNSAESTFLPKNWEKSKDVYTGDDLIDAFLRGKKVGQDEHYRILSKQLEENINKAAELAENLFDEISKNKIQPIEIHLKAEDITKYKALVIVSKDDFISDNFRQVYTIARKIKDKSETENFYISFAFTTSSEHLNEQLLLSDGFFMKYEKK